MTFSKDHAKKNVLRINTDEDFENEALPHIRKFERQTENSERAQAALEKSKKIFGPFRKTHRVEKSAFVKSQEKSFLQAEVSNSDKD